jgi:hypothetical protein
MDTRKDIGEAIGILMARYQLCESDAFARIVRASQDGNVKLRELANTIIYTRTCPNRSTREGGQDRRSDHENRSRLACRRSTATSCRTASNSAVRTAARSPAHRGG